jgi:hypothetical protein
MTLRRHTPLRRGGFLRRRTRLRAISPRHRHRLDEYFRRRDRFLAQPGNQWCIVAWTLWGRKLPVTDIHHKRGRYGTNFLDESTWLAVSREGHDWIHRFPKDARARGWMG